MRNPVKIVQPRRRTTNYGLKTVSYIGAKIWNELPFIDSTCIADIDETVFKHRLSGWNVPESNMLSYPYV